MSQFRRHQHNSHAALQTEDRENVFKQANTILSKSTEKEFRNESKFDDSNKFNGSISSSKDIMDKIRRKYPSKNATYIESSGECNTKENEENAKDDDLLLFCDGDEAEKNKDRLLSFDAKKYELVTADEKFDDSDDFEYNREGSFESSLPNESSPKIMIAHANSQPQIVPGCKHRQELLKADVSSSQSSFKSGTSQISLASFVQTATPPNTMIDSCLECGKEEPIKQTLLNALHGLKD